MNSYHDIEQIMQHLSAQDAELLRHAKMLEHLLEKNGISLQQLEAEVGKADHLEIYTEKLSTNSPATTDEGNAPFIAIPLTQGYKTIVDLEEADLAQLKWQINRERYAMRRPRIPGSRTERLVVLMHRVLVDLADVDLACFKWAYANGRYAMRRIERQGVYQRFFMHRIILERKLGRPVAEGIVTDHINGNGLDNRRENLREATQLQNMHNLQMHRDNTAHYKGVRRITTCTWEARLDERPVGYYDAAEDASFAYDKAALQLYGEKARLNHPFEQVQAWTPPDRLLRKTNTSGFRGVQPKKNRWAASIHVPGMRSHLGMYATPEEAARAFDRAALKAYGESARLNFPREDYD